MKEENGEKIPEIQEIHDGNTVVMDSVKPPIQVIDEKKNSATLFIILVVVSMCIIGFILYYLTMIK